MSGGEITAVPLARIVAVRGSGRPKEVTVVVALELPDGTTVEAELDRVQGVAWSAAVEPVLPEVTIRVLAFGLRLDVETYDPIRGGSR